MNRDEMLGRLTAGNEVYDFIIIGGGATGIGILLEAVTRGYNTALLEASDFTKSTSSKSTKLVHGGVRYLAQGNIHLVREASIERGILRKNAPHIVKDQSFVVPVFSWLDALIYIVGLKVYDLLAGKYRLGSSIWLGRKKVLSLLPNLKRNGLKGGILYHDGQFDDSRLAISCLQTAIKEGGVAVNYMPVSRLLKNEAGRLNGVIAKDAETGSEYTINGKYIINATGVFADQVMQLDFPEHKRTIRPSQGIHLVIGEKFLQGSHALMIPKTEDGRVLFAVPWLGRLVVGTTDTPVTNISDEPAALEEEIEFILKTSSDYLVNAPTRKDVLSVFAGLRPLADSGESGKTKEISRSHKISVSGSGLITIVGGKWTTFRKMAEDLIDRAEKVNKLQKTSSISREIPLFGYSKGPESQGNLSMYGTEAEEIKKIEKKNGSLKLLNEKLGITSSMVIYFMRYEMALHLEDVLARRTRCLLLDAREAMLLAEPVAEIMAAEGGFGQDWMRKEVENFQKLCTNYIL